MMECRTVSKGGEIVTTTPIVITEVSDDTTAIADTRVTDAVVETMDTGDPMVPVDSMGSGDATSPPTITLENDQDPILTIPSVIELLPPLVGVGELSDCDISVPMAVEGALELNGLPANWMIQEIDDHNILLSPKDINDIWMIFAGIPEEDDSKTTFDLAKLEMLFRCEACQEMPISSETVYTCDFGHQVCGYCFMNGTRTCLVCKGHLTSNNVPLENVLRRLRQNYPHMFDQDPPPVGIGNDINYLSRYYSLKPIVCPHHGCTFKTSARTLFQHFKYEHIQIPKITVALFEPCKVLVPEVSLDITSSTVIAVVNVSLTEKNIASRLATNIMTCWVQCGALNIGKQKALVLWVSCVYEEAIMPPILFSLRAPTGYGYSSFGGQMTSVLEYTDPQSVLASGRCLLLFPNDIENVSAFNNGSLVNELKFYLY